MSEKVVETASYAGESGESPELSRNGKRLVKAGVDRVGSSQVH